MWRRWSLLMNTTLLACGLIAMSLASTVEAAFGFKCPGGCKPGFVWRGLNKTDLVCIDTYVQGRIREDNKLAAERRVRDLRRPAADLSNFPSTKIPCKPGYEWRQATPEDYVCVDFLEKELSQKSNKTSASGCSTAVCKQFTMQSPELEITQSNGYKIYLGFSHGSFVDIDGNTPIVFGSAHYESGNGPVTGLARGSLKKNRFDVTVQWDNATRGRYQGDITPDGEVTNGLTSDESNPTAPSVSWHLSQVGLGCMRFG